MGLCRLAASLVAMLSLLTIVKSLLAKDGATELAMVTEVHSALSKRELSPLPDYLHVKFDVDGSPVNLRLVRNSNINVNAPVTFEGEKTEKRNNIAMVTDSDVYQDITNAAAISITVGSDEDGAAKRTLEGSFVVNGKRYSIKPAPVRLSELSRVLKKRLIHSGAKGHLHEIQQLTSVGRSAEGDDVVKENVDRLWKANTADGRRKRAAVGAIAAYHVELTMALDHTIWEKYMQENRDGDRALKALRYDYGHQVNGMDLAFKLIDTETAGFSIALFLSKYRIARTFTTSKWTTDAITTTVAGDYTKTLIDSDKALRNIGKWSVAGGRTWKSTDHVMLWTRYDIRQYDKLSNAMKSDPIGMAPLAGICRPGQSVSLVQFYSFQSWAISAHELGHNLGAAHDKDSSEECSPSLNYIMKPSMSFVVKDRIQNAYMFSPCSIAQFKATLSGNEAHRRWKGYITWPRVCLTNRVCDHDELVDLDQLPGAKYSLDEQCELIIGDGSTFYRKKRVDVCYRLICATPWKRGYYRTFSLGAARGTPCGSNNKCCLQGRCVSDCSIPPAHTDTTCSGTGLPTDVPQGCSDTYSARYCDLIVLSHPSYCFHGVVRTGCCKTCHRAGIVTPTQHWCVDKHLSWCPKHAWFCKYRTDQAARFRAYCPVTCGTC